MKLSRSYAGIFLLATLATGCSNNPQKTLVELSIPNSMIENESEKLYFYEEGVETPIDSVDIPASEPNASDRVVKHELSADTTKRIIASYSDLFIYLFSEPGTVKGNLKTDFSVRGTTLNDEFAEFESTLQKEMEPLQLKAEMTKREDTLTDRQKDSVYMSLENEEEALAARMYSDVISKHLNDILGAVLLEESYALLTPQQFIDFTNKSSDVVKKYPKMQDLITITKNALATSEGKPYQEVTGIDPKNEKELKLSQFVKPGNYTIVDFWASWCGPCRREIKVLQNIYNKYKNQKFQIVGIAIWDETSKTLQAIDKLGIQWPIIFQHAERTNKKEHKYGISAIPTLILIDPNGTILVRSHSSDEIEKILKEAFEK